MDRGAWQAKVHGVAKELDMTEWLNSNHCNTSCIYTSPFIDICLSFLKLNIKTWKRGGLNWLQCSCVCVLSCVWLFVTSWTVAHQAPLSMGFLRQEPWSGLPFPPPRNLSNPGMEPRSPALKADSLLSEPPGKPTFMGYLPLYANHFMRPENREESDLSPKNYGNLNQMLCQRV